MKITFDPNLRVAGLGVVPWTRLGPEQWLPQYSIASLHDWDASDVAGTPPVFALADAGVINGKMNTQTLLETESFQELLDRELPGYDLLTYKPVTVPRPLAARKFLMTDKSFTRRYENKVWFRERFAGELDFPRFMVMSRDELGAEPSDLKRLLAGRSAIVLQDERLSGGKGTHLVSDHPSYQKALAALPSGNKVVVSDMVQSARERSIQACVTETEVFTGPLQRQVIREPLLVNPDTPGVNMFCGAEILNTDQGTETHAAAARMARRIGEALREDGYRGIFGVDFLLDAAGRLFVIEVNPRITGVTPLLSSLYKGEQGVPFYLLHILALGGYEYEITDRSADFTREGAMLIIHSLSGVPVTIKDLPESGVYRLEEGKPVLVRRSLAINDLAAGEFVFQRYIQPGTVAGKGGRLATLLFDRPVIDTNTNKLYNDVSRIITAMRDSIHT